MSVASLLVLTSALLHAGWNAALKREAAPQRAVGGVLAFACLFAAIAAVASGGPTPRGAALAWSLASGLLEGLYFLTLAAALARAGYGVVYAVARGGALLVVWPIAAGVLGEAVSAGRLAGVVLLGAGVVLVAAGGRLRASPAGLALAAACAGSIGGYHLTYHQALQAGAAEAPLFAISLAVALPLVWLAGRRGGGAPPSRGELSRWAMAGALAATSFLLFLAGLSRSGPGVALTLRNSSVLFAQAIAALMGEPVPPRQVLGAVLVTAGAALVA